jgi:hypothetical protein
LGRRGASLSARRRSFRVTEQSSRDFIAVASE